MSVNQSTTPTKVATAGRPAHSEILRIRSASVRVPTGILPGRGPADTLPPVREKAQFARVPHVHAVAIDRVCRGGGGVEARPQTRLESGGGTQVRTRDAGGRGGREARLRGVEYDRRGVRPGEREATDHERGEGRAPQQRVRVGGQGLLRPLELPEEAGHERDPRLRPRDE